MAYAYYMVETHNSANILHLYIAYANKALKLAIHVIMHCTPSIPVGINVPFPSGVPWALYLGTYTYGAKREAFKRKDFP